MMISRRKALAAVGCVSAGTLAGCAGFRSDAERLTLELLNFDSEPHEMAVEVLRADADEHSDAAVLRERYELETPPEAEDRVASQRVEEDVLESDRYLVRVHLEDAPATRESYQYYPDCASSDDISDRLYIEVRTESETGERYIEFKQNRCSRSSSGWI